MSDNQSSSYEQLLLNRVISLTREADNLKTAYLIVNTRLNKLTSLTTQTSKMLMDEAAKVEDFARLALEATKLTEKSALITNNKGLIDAATKSTIAAAKVHCHAVALRTIKMANLAINNS